MKQTIIEEDDSNTIVAGERFDWNLDDVEDGSTREGRLMRSFLLSLCCGAGTCGGAGGVQSGTSDSGSLPDSDGKTENQTKPSASSSCRSGTSASAAPCQLRLAGVGFSGSGTRTSAL